jgi:hypothetical protein
LRKDPKYNNISDRELEDRSKAYAEEQMKGLHALHGPDLVAGGGKEILRLGPAGINMSIGAQWPSRIGLIDEVVNPLVPLLSEPQKKEVYMNVLLDPVEVDWS